MKPLKLILIGVTSCSLASCADFFLPYNQSDQYRWEMAEKRADAVRREYWVQQNKPVVAPALEKRFTAITIPEQTLPDGTIIEAHTEYVETVRPLTN